MRIFTSPQRNLPNSAKPNNYSTLEGKALRLATKLKEKADIPWSAIGVSGSIMAGLTTATSDIDPLVYGVENSRKVYAALQELRQDIQIQASNPTAKLNSKPSTISAPKTPK